MRVNKLHCCLDTSCISSVRSNTRKKFKQSPLTPICGNNPFTDCSILGLTPLSVLEIEVAIEFAESYFTNSNSANLICVADFNSASFIYNFRPATSLDASLTPGTGHPQVYLVILIINYFVTLLVVLVANTVATTAISNNNNNNRLIVQQ